MTDREYRLALAAWMVVRGDSTAELEDDLEIVLQQYYPDLVAVFEVADRNAAEIERLDIVNTELDTELEMER